MAESDEGVGLEPASGIFKTAPRADRDVKPSKRAFKQARRDLEWFFAQADAAMGRRGAGLEPHAPAVWDAARSGREHGRRHEVLHRELVDRYARVAPLVARLSPGMLAVARAAFAPSTNDWALRFAFADSAGYDSLVDVALMTPAVLSAYAKRHPGKPATRGQLVEMLMGDARKKPAPAYFGVALREARAMVLEVLDAYDHILQRAEAA